MSLKGKALSALVVFFMLMTVTAASALPQGNHPATDSQNNERERFQQTAIKFDKLDIITVKEERGQKDRINDFKGDFNRRNNDKVKVVIVAKCTVLGNAFGVNPVLSVGGKNVAFQKVGRGNQFIAVFRGDLTKKGDNYISEKATFKGQIIKGSQLVIVKEKFGHWTQSVVPLVSSNEGPRR